MAPERMHIGDSRTRRHKQRRAFDLRRVRLVVRRNAGVADWSRRTSRNDLSLQTRSVHEEPRRPARVRPAPFVQRGQTRGEFPEQRERSPAS